MLINPTIKDYCDDLLYENKCLFAMNESIKQYRNTLKKQLLNEMDLVKCDDDLKKIGALVGRIVGLGEIYKKNNREIAENLKKVDGLKNGSLKEI